MEKNKNISILMVSIVFIAFISFGLFISDIFIDNKIEKFEEKLLEIDKTVDNLITLENNSTNLARAIYVTGYFGKETEYYKMTEEIKLNILKFKKIANNKEISEELDYLLELHGLTSELESTSLNFAKKKFNIVDKNLMDNLNYVYYRSNYFKTLFNVTRDVKKDITAKIKTNHIRHSNINAVKFILNCTLIICIIVLLRSVSIFMNKQKELLKKIEEDNLSLENKVSERTQEIEEQNREIKLKMEESEKLSESLSKEILGRKKTEKNLRENKHLLNTLINSIPSAVFMKNMEGKIILANRFMAKFFGFEHEEITGKYIQEIYLKEVEENSEAQDKILIENREHLSYEQSMQLKNGKTVYMQVDKAPLIDEDGEIYGICGIITDITDIWLKEKALVKEKEKLNHILDMAPVGIFIAVNNVIRFVNPVLSNMVDLHINGDCTNACVDMNHKNMITEELNRNRSMRNIEIEMYNSKKEIRDILGTFFKVEFEGEDGMIGWLVDITEIKQSELAMKKAKEIAEEATRIKSEFLANMSHEIRTPMNAVMGFTKLLERTELTPKQHDYVVKIGISAENLLGIINDILDFSKIEANRMELELTKFNLDETLAHITNVVSFKAFEKGLEFVVSKDTDVPLNLIGDPLRLSQVLTNLISNSIKFTEVGEVVLKVRREKAGEGKVRLFFVVYDTGIGMKPDQLSRLFSAFRQADSSTTRKYGGTGLGLVISKNIVEKMGGTLEVSSVYGEGTSFYFSIVLDVSKDDIKKIVIPDKFKGLKVLVADDSDTARELISEYIINFEMIPVEATSGEEAIQMAKKDIDLIIMDYKMPGINGLDAWKRIKENLGENAPKIIIITAHEAEDIAVECKQAGIKTMLTKPVSQSNLFNSIALAFEENPEIGPVKNKSVKTYDLTKAKGVKVLLVEDNEINRQIATETLEHEGFEVEIAENGRDAVNMVNAKKYDVVLMDLQMPVMDGYEASKEIRMQEKFKDLPIIALSADAMSGTRSRVEAAGMNDYVTKPINVDELFEVLIKWIKVEKREKRTEKESAVNETLKDETIETLYQKLKSFNVKEALLRVSSNYKLYIDILKKFEESNADFVEKLNTDLKDGDIESAKRALHTLKGVSSNIGNYDIQKLTAILEAQIKEGGDISGSIELKDLDISLKIALEEIRKIKSNSLNLSEDILDTETLKTKLQELIGFLNSFNVKAENVFNEINRTLLSIGYSDEVLNLEKLIKAYNFETAEKICLNMLNDLNQK